MARARVKIMGKILQIRVSAWTYKEEDVLVTWPNLVSLTWSTPPYYGEKRGVLELVDALENQLSFGGWSETVKRTLQQGIHEVVQTKKKLELALANWKPEEANTLSNIVEDQLTELNQNVLLH